MDPRGIIPKAMEENTQSTTFRNGPLFMLPPYDMMQTGLLCRTPQWYVIKACLYAEKKPFAHPRAS